MVRVALRFAAIGAGIGAATCAYVPIWAPAIGAVSDRAVTPAPVSVPVPVYATVPTLGRPRGSVPRVALYVPVAYSVPMGAWEALAVGIAVAMSIPLVVVDTFIGAAIWSNRHNNG